jgi:hypothetical protein
MVFAFFLAGCGGAGPSPSATRSTTTTLRAAPVATSTTVATKSVNIPVVVCPTTVAIAAQPPIAPLPTSVSVDLPESMADRVVVYVDKGNRTMLLGPKGWTCVAAYGADGSGGIDLYAPGEPAAHAFSPVPIADQAITIAETGGSPVHAAGQACPYFPAAATVTQSAIGHGCPAPPQAERVTAVSSSVVAFDDPPGTKGGGVPLGGPYLASSVMSYSQSSQPGTYLATCTLPASGQRICAFVLSYFEYLYGGTRSSPVQVP